MKKISLIIISVFILSFSGCDILSGILDGINDNNNNNNNPGQTTTSITSPQNGTTFTQGDSITVSAVAENPDGIKKVTLYVDNSSHSSDQSSPYKYTVTGLGVGSHNLFVRALDLNGTNTDSSKISITVKEATSNVSKKFTVSSVNDNLDNSDGQDFINGFKNLNFTLDKWDKNVSKNNLKGYLGQKQEFHYHTGHGDVGIILTSDGSLSSSNLTVNTRGLIVATCLTMSNTNWKNVFGSTAEIIMGYTKVSYDKPTDNNQVKGFLSKLSAGNSYLISWYKSNIALSDLDDRWLAYVKEGSKIVEYSARSNNTPKSIPRGIPIVVYDNITVDSNLLDSATIFDRGFQGAVAEPMESPLTGGDLSRSAWPTNQVTISIDDAINIAEDEMANRGGKPANSIFYKVTPIQKCDELNNCYTSAYQVQYVQEYDGRMLRNNVSADYISLLIDDSGLVLMDLSWSRIIPNDDTIPTRSMLNVADALSIAGESISQYVRHNAINIVGYINVDGVMTQEDGTKIVVPAYEFFSENNEKFVVNAVTGELVF